MDLSRPHLVSHAGLIPVMGLLRHGAFPVLFGGLRAPSTRVVSVVVRGNVPQPQKVHRQFLAELARRARLLPGADVLAFPDVGSHQKRVYGYREQRAAFGHTKIQGKSLLVRGLNVLAASICTPLATPAIAAARLRCGRAPSARDAAASMITETVTTPSSSKPEYLRCGGGHFRQVVALGDGAAWIWVMGEALHLPRNPHRGHPPRP